MVCAVRRHVDMVERAWTEARKSENGLGRKLSGSVGRGHERRGIAVKTAQELGLAKLPDDELLRKVTERGDVLITMDRGFWSDGKFPLHQRGAIVFVDGKDAGIARTEGIELLMDSL